MTTTSRQQHAALLSKDEIALWCQVNSVDGSYLLMQLDEDMLTYGPMAAQIGFKYQILEDGSLGLHEEAYLREQTHLEPILLMAMFEDKLIAEGRSRESYTQEYERIIELLGHTQG